MPKTNDSSNSHSVLIADEDVSDQIRLRYLFSEILKFPVPTFSGSSGAHRLLEMGVNHSILIAGRTEKPGANFKLIETAAGMENRPLILFLDRQETPEDGLKAFLAGAHDVIRAPFSLKEFTLRMFARLGEKPPGYLDFDKDWDAQAVITSRAKLTSAELQVAQILMSQSGQIVTRDDLSNAIDNRPWVYGDRKFDVHIAKIRKKLNHAFGDHISVETIRSAGYCLTMSDPNQV